MDSSGNCEKIASASDWAEILRDRALKTAGPKSTAAPGPVLSKKVLMGLVDEPDVDEWCREFAAMSQPSASAQVEAPWYDTPTPILRKKVVFLGPWATNDELSRISEQWLERLGGAAAIEFDCAVARPPFCNEDDLECPGFWMNPKARSDDQRYRLLRKQAFAGIVAALHQVSRSKPDLIVGLGQGATIALLMTRPLVVEAACRARVVMPETLNDFRQTWARVRSIVVLNPVLLPGRSDPGLLLAAIPEIVRIQPSFCPSQIVLSKKYVHAEFARTLAAKARVKVEVEAPDGEGLRAALSRPPRLVRPEDTGICAVCGKKGAMGGCIRCGLLMHYTCVHPGQGCCPPSSEGCTHV